jgi:hypothetical protein
MAEEKSKRIKKKKGKSRQKTWETKQNDGRKKSDLSVSRISFKRLN